MPTFRRLNGVPPEVPEDDDREVPCAANGAGHYCFIHGSKLFRTGNWTLRQRNIFEVYWQKIQYYKFEFMGGSHILGQCDHDTFAAFAEMVGIRGLYWEDGTAWYIDA